jgi:hypothetical protein
MAILAVLAVPVATFGEGIETPVPSCWPGPPGSDPRSCAPNDSGYRDSWEFWSDIPASVDLEKMHPAERSLGAIGISLDRAWQYTTGRDDVVIAVLDSGIRWDDADLVHKIYINPGEVPPPQGATSHDANGDGRFDIRDYAGDPRVGDRNDNGTLDAGDLILAFSDCVDDDGNGYADDISGYDFFGLDSCGKSAGDNDPFDDTDFGHGTGIASTAAAETDNGIGDAGVCPDCRVMPVRVGDSFVVDANRFARGVTFAVNAGASVIASALGSYNNTPAARAAIDLAYDSGVPVIASAADEFAYHHNYPSVYNHALYVNAIRFNHLDDYRQASTFWGVNPCTNFGPRVWVTVPAESCSSGATSRLAGVAGLVEAIARDEGLGDLHAEDVYQVLRASADDLDNTDPDWGHMRYPARPGFDQLYGYGRVNALRAVQMVKDRRIPPRVDLDNPEWFAIVSPTRDRFMRVRGTIRTHDGRKADWRLEYALGVEPTESEYVRIVGGEVADGTYAGELGTLDFQRLPVPRGPAPRNREERDRFSVTLRLRVVDARGLVGEARRSFFVLDDPAWKAHFPVRLGASGEASPLVVDLDRDGRAEIVLPTADGMLRIIDWYPGGLRTIRVAVDPGEPVGPSVERPRETLVRSAAVGDLNGDGTPSIVVASKDGRVYAFTPRGERLAAFPVSIDRARARPTGPQQVIEHGIFTRPVLADLDGKPGAEILVAALDGNLYVWRHDGSMLEGFPVALEMHGESPGRRAKIVSTPAVGDIDGDGVPEIVVGSNRVRDGLAGIFALRSRGRAHPQGAFLPGWQPFPVDGVRPDLLPTVARGVQMDPVLFDADGDGADEVFVYAVTGNSIMLLDQPAEGPPRVRAEFSLTPGGASTFRDTAFLGGTGSPMLADTDGDDVPELYAPLLPLRMITLRFKPGVPIDASTALGGWPLPASLDTSKRIPMLPRFPRRMEDLMLLSRPASADVDGDGMREVLVGSGGYLLHAFRASGGEAPGFPKFTGGWLMTQPAVGDLDGDGVLELVSVTREGYLFAWELKGAAAPVASR